MMAFLKKQLKNTDTIWLSSGLPVANISHTSSMFTGVMIYNSKCLVVSLSWLHYSTQCELVCLWLCVYLVILCMHVNRKVCLIMQTTSYDPALRSVCVCSCGCMYAICASCHMVTWHRTQQWPLGEQIALSFTRQQQHCIVLNLRPAWTFSFYSGLCVSTCGMCFWTNFSPWQYYCIEK